MDGTGKVHALAATPLPAPLRVGPGVEQDPRLWWPAVRDALLKLLAQIEPDCVAAVAVDGTSGTVLLADADGEPLGPALMYNDGRATEQARRIGQVAPQDCAAHGAASGLAKLLWLQATEAGRQARFVLSQADWIVGRLTGLWGLSDDNSALKLGYDPVRRCWPGWLSRLGVRTDTLPRVLSPGTPIRPLSGEARRLFGLPASTVLVAGTTDSTASFMATGASRAGEAVTALGSTLVMKVLAERPLFAPTYGVYSQPLHGLWLVGGGSNSGGGVLRQYFTDAQLAAMTPRLKPEQPTGLDYYPLPSPGERFPVSDPALPPRLSPRPDDAVQFFQGLLEGMARIEREAYRLLASLGAPYPVSVRSTGGGARNAAWTAIRGALMGIPMLEAEQQEAAYGAALLARQGALSQARS
jgi:sugar (pentulose or hexulose) kinase